MTSPTLPPLPAAQVLPEVVYAEQLALLTKLTNLTSLTLEPEDGADAGMILAPLPSELLDLPHLVVRLGYVSNCWIVSSMSSACQEIV